MLINEKGQQVHVPTGKDLSDNAKRMLREVHAPLPYKNHPFFRLENRVRMVSYPYERTTPLNPITRKK